MYISIVYYHNCQPKKC
ncbi:MAG: hypothetical protein LCH58_11765 [Bacteroidetes bacterium]|nr:hypothetical protein [Bacteroidota bacterium]